MKFKNIKKKSPPAGGKKTQFPRNSRIIPAFKLYRRTLKIFVGLIFLLTAIIVGLDLRGNIQVKQAIDSQRAQLTKELKFWESFIAKHQNYRDAYFQVSVVEYRLGNSAKARMYVGKGLSLDPNSETGKKIEDLLNK